MAERKFIRIPAKDLPDLFYVPDDKNAPEDGGKNVYFARYRIASEDGVLASRWSPKFEVPTGVSGSNIALYTGAVVGQPAEYSVTKGSGSPKILSITWNVDRLFLNKKIFTNRFHVYVRFHNNETETAAPWSFMGETTSTNFSTVAPSGKNKVDVAVLVPTYRGLDAATTSTVSPETLYPESVLLVKTDFTL
jgi:hypothetical protein